MYKPDEQAGGDLRWYDANEELELIMREAKLEDLWYFGEFFTWPNGQGHTIMRKLNELLSMRSGLLILHTQRLGSFRQFLWTTLLVTIL